MTSKGESSSSTEIDLKELFQDGTTNLDTEVWLKNLRDKIYTMFKTPLKEEYNVEAFKWISTLCMCQPRFSWLCSTPKKWSKDDAKMFSLIARLSINEIHILLPQIRRHLIFGEEIEMEDGKVLARPPKLEDYDNFGIHLHIFEDTVHALISEQNEGGTQDETKLTDVMEASELHSLLKRLKEIVGQLFDYLEDVNNHWTTLTQELDSRRFLAAQGALRAVYFWVAEDDVEFQDKPKHHFLIELMVKNLLISPEHSEMDLDLLVVALHSICLGEEQTKEKLKHTPQFREALQKYLDHIQQEQLRNKSSTVASKDSKRREKRFKLQCGLIKDLLT